MGYGVYKAPDGKYAIWCTVTDDWAAYNCSERQVRKWWREQFGETAMFDFDNRVMPIANGERPHPIDYNFENRFVTREWRHHGEDPQDRRYERWLETWRTPEIEAQVAEILKEIEEDEAQECPS